MIPFSKEHVESMKAGDKFFTEGFLQGVTDEQVRWTVTNVDSVGPVLSAKFCGVSLGRFAATVSKKGKVVLSATS